MVTSWLVICLNHSNIAILQSVDCFPVEALQIHYFHFAVSDVTCFPCTLVTYNNRTCSNYGNELGMYGIRFHMHELP